MKIPVLIEPIGNDRFRARGVSLGLEAEGHTSEEALERVQEQLRSRLSQGGQLAFVETESREQTGPAEHPLAKFAGCMSDEPLYEDWQAAVAEYRASCDREGA